MALDDHHHDPVFNEYYEASEFGFCGPEEAEAALDAFVADPTTQAILDWFGDWYVRVYDVDGLWGWEVTTEDWSEEHEDVV